MIIKYVEKQGWRKMAIASPEILYSSSNKKRLRSTLKKIHEHGITYSFEPLTEDFLQLFTPLYVELIGKKSNAVVHNLLQKTLHNDHSSYTYWSLKVLMNNTTVGGAIIFSNDELFMVAYRAFIPKWPTGTLQASPSLLAEYLTALEAFKQNKFQVSHGKDRNLFGMNSSIGQLIYKLSVGYKPQLPIIKDGEETILQINTLDITQDTVILHYPSDGLSIDKATLVTSKETEDKYHQLFQYPQQLEVDVQYRN